MEINETSHDDYEFISQIMSVLLTDHVYVYTDSGQCIELPTGSTTMNFICEVFPDKLDNITGIIVNGKEVDLNEPLKNNDRIQIKINGKIAHEVWDAKDRPKTFTKKPNETNNAE
jgi:GTP pyrophosphokinase